MNSTEALAIIDRIAAAKGRIEKEQVLAELLADPFGVKVAQYAYDPFITYGITPAKPRPSLGDREFLSDGLDVFKWLDDLAKRKITGNAAHECIADLYAELDQEPAELLWRILSKDFRAGVTAKSINIVRPGTIDTFEVMLSHKYEERHIKTFPVAVEPKLDGLRAPCLIKNGQGKFFSRVGNHFPALDDLGAQVATVIGRLFNELKMRTAAVDITDHTTFITDFEKGLLKLMGGADQEHPTLALDGEVLSGMFAETSGAARRKGEKATNAEFHVFDMVPYKVLTDYRLREFRLIAKVRRTILDRIQNAVVDEPLYLVPRRIANSHEEVQMIFEEYRETTLAYYLARGDVERELELLPVLMDLSTGGSKTLEGAIVKPLAGVYEKKRSRSWLKMKAEETEDLRVISKFEGKPNTKYEGKLGGLIVDRDGVEVRVGGGFSDAQREEYWVTPPIGRLIEVEFHEVTPDGSLRHPRFVRFRDDKDEAMRAA